MAALVEAAISARDSLLTIIIDFVDYVALTRKLQDV